MYHVALSVDISCVCPVAPKTVELVQTPAVAIKSEPIPNPNLNPIPRPESVNQVPVVSPAIVTVLYSQVLATLIA